MEFYLIEDDDPNLLMRKLVICCFYGRTRGKLATYLTSPQRVHIHNQHPKYNNNVRQSTTEKQESESVTGKEDSIT